MALKWKFSMQFRALVAMLGAHLQGFVAAVHIPLGTGAQGVTLVHAAWARAIFLVPVGRASVDIWHFLSASFLW